MPQFISGIELSRRFYQEAVRPILDARFPSLPHAAAHIGPGSDVLGFDTEMSTDHDWGPGVLLFLRDADAGLGDDIRAVMSQDLPHLFAGYPVGMSAPDPEGVRQMQHTLGAPLEHRVRPTTLRAFIWQQLAYDIDRPLDAADWLTIPSQKLRELTAGAVHHDQVGELTSLRERLAWYPQDVWLYLLASCWQRIGQEEHLMPRAGYVGDELGSALIGSRLVRDIMNLCFLIERKYAPYPKWFGTAFKQLDCAGALAPALWRAQTAPNWREREAALCEAYTYVARMHNRLGITEQLLETISSFYGRPFQAIYGGQFAAAICAQIAGPDVRRIAAGRLIGSIDQWSDSTDIRADPTWRQILRQLYA
jgi:Domain of unknown function (DUF4037)